MAQTVEIDGLDELVESFKNADSNLNRIGRGFLKSLSDYGVKQVQIQILNIGAVDTNELIQGIHYELSQTSSGLQSVIKPSDRSADLCLERPFLASCHVNGLSR